MLKKIYPSKRFALIASLVDMYSSQKSAQTFLGGNIVSRPNFCCDPVVLELICYRTRAKRLINKGVRKKGQNLNFYLETDATPHNIYFIRLRIMPKFLVHHTGVWMTLYPSNFFQLSSCFGLVYQLFCSLSLDSRSTPIQLDHRKKIGRVANQAREYFSL